MTLNSLMDLENKTAIYILNKQGLLIAQKIKDLYKKVDIFVKESLINQRFLNSYPCERDKFYSFYRLKDIVCKKFTEYKLHIFICATGIVVRTICSVITSKDKDPAVLVIDPGGKFVISLLSGHLGGANEFAKEIAKILNATPVITTATDSMGLPAIDDIARKLNLKIDDIKKIKIINSAILNYRSIYIYDPLNILKIQKYFPVDYPIIQINDLNILKKTDIAIICDFKKIDTDTNKIILYPEVLYVGVGCNKNTDVSEILYLLDSTFKEHNLSLDSIYAIVTTDKKNSETGILKLAEILKKRLIFIEHHLLNSVSVPNPSENVKKHMDVYSVCEAAATIASKGRLLIEKVKSKNATIAVAVKI